MSYFYKELYPLEYFNDHNADIGDSIFFGNVAIVKNAA
jgi:hypothetical protein